MYNANSSFFNTKKSNYIASNHKSLRCKQYYEAPTFYSIYTIDNNCFWTENNKKACQSNSSTFYLQHKW